MRSLVEFLKASSPQESASRFQLADEAEKNAAQHLLKEPTLKLFASIKLDHTTHFKAWVAWVRTILPLYPPMHAHFVSLCSEQTELTVQAHFARHQKPKPTFEHRVKRAFEDCPFMVAEGSNVYVHAAMAQPAVDMYPIDLDFARPHFDFLASNCAAIRELVQAKAGSLARLCGAVVHPVQLSAHFMKTWSSLASKLRRGSRDPRALATQVDRAALNELFSRDTFRLRVEVVETF